MPEQEKSKKTLFELVVFVALNLGALIAFVTAIVQVWRDHVASAGVAATLTIVMFLLASFSELESFAAFGITVKRLQQTVKEAKAEVKKLRRLGLISAKQKYLSMAF